MSDIFICYDCHRKLQAADASHDLRWDEEIVAGIVCQDCVADSERLMAAWPQKEVA